MDLDLQINKYFIGDKFSEIYKNILYNIFYKSEYENSPRNFKQKEITNLLIILTNPLSNMYKNVIREINEKYLYGELYWYFSGRNDLEFISQYSKFWNNIADENNKLNSAYGYLLFSEKNEFGLTEWEWALNSLLSDKDSRQAIIRFNKPQHSYYNNKDFVCTLNGIFQIRNNKLNFTTTMRSQDMWYGIVYDVPFFTLLQQQMRLHLLPKYPDLELGTYSHFISSAHIYEKNFIFIENMLKNEFEEHSLPKLTDDVINKFGNCLINNDKNDDFCKNLLKYVKI